MQSIYNMRSEGLNLKSDFSFVPVTKQLPGKTERRFWAKFSPIFHWFSTDGTPSAHMFTDYAYFPPVVPHPYYKLKHMLPICRFSAHMFTDFAYFPLIFCLFSA